MLRKKDYNKIKRELLTGKPYCTTIIYLVKKSTAYVETDIHARYNPTSKGVIEKATGKLAEKINLFARYAKRPVLE